MVNCRASGHILALLRSPNFGILKWAVFRCHLYGGTLRYADLSHTLGSALGCMRGNVHLHGVAISACIALLYTLAVVSQ